MIIRRTGLVALAGAFLALGAAAQAPAPGVEALVKDLQANKDIAAGAKALAARTSVEALHGLFKPRDKGGLGFGPKGKGDGIEMALINLGKRANDAAVKKMKDDLVKMAHVNLAIAEVTEHLPVPKKAGKGAKEWKKHTDDMRKAAKGLVAAAGTGKGAAVKKAATNLNVACNNCHADFRDN